MRCRRRCRNKNYCRKLQFFESSIAIVAVSEWVMLMFAAHTMHTVLYIHKRKESVCTSNLHIWQQNDWIFVIRNGCCSLFPFDHSVSWELKRSSVGVICGAQIVFPNGVTRKCKHSNTLNNFWFIRCSGTCYSPTSHRLGRIEESPTTKDRESMINITKNSDSYVSIRHTNKVSFLLPNRWGVLFFPLLSSSSSTPPFRLLLIFRFTFSKKKECRW